MHDSHELTMYSITVTTLLCRNSYLGLGLMAARKDVLLHGQPDYTPGSDELLRSPCINPTVDTHWQYGGHTYHLT